eukprot:7068733-Heterocapsa_arctica.AAC.1
MPRRTSASSSVASRPPCSMQAAPGRPPACPTGAWSASKSRLPTTSRCPWSSPTRRTGSWASSPQGASSPTSSSGGRRPTPLR